ncbi:putative Thioesterase-like superfamily [Monocercomonoides exilis]|uniref:putative Thioesterase-like superfamily n=1 Tax=Monocercomonoides exilis TaxID=2049356 RepID=UPI00355A41A2|nr:putative Thioesterase-like superfamily [Monocercomonoides exilis]|eukprot:MONOS_354.1-p1 / transcript=MONOS_354.1 / gene=MONOS_354 / organism=Monocercomonoides_exilis_PA203 / gene_product=unspecified product / transcript_product=unspecified product / location=Mono_scaffold00006:8656-9210(+) / protein_length=184 / sequence_SO=supercontig / SO=protein_coding / is_pseudo=false
MAYYIRTIINLCHGKFFVPKIPLLSKYTWKSRVTIFDVDKTFNVNDIGYLQIAEQARWSWSCNVGLLKILSEKKINPVVSLLSCRIREPLRIFQAFTVTSEIVHVDERGFYVFHKITSKDKVTATLLLKLQLVAKNGIASPVKLMEEENKMEKLPFLEVGTQGGDALRVFYALESYLLDKPIFF